MMALEFSTSNEIIKLLKNIQRYNHVNIAEDYSGCSSNLIEDEQGEFIKFEDLYEIIKKAEIKVEEIYCFV